MDSAAGIGRLVLRAGEVILLFVGVPLLLELGWLPLGPTVLAALFLVVLALSLDRGFRFGELFSWARHRPTRRETRTVLVRFALAATVLTAATWYFRPGLLFGFVRARPDIFALVCVLYPLFSVLPQELAFRVFFLRRYGSLFPRPLVMAAVNAALFGWAHVFLGFEVAVPLSAVGGWFFCRTWQRSGSIYLVWLEHALYGILIFTIGLGRYFYHGAAG